jgi:putative endonuclease
MGGQKRYYVYLLTNNNDNIMYIGVTNNLQRRIYEHKNKLVKGFTEKYNVHKLVYYEETPDIRVALEREKEIKKWRRAKKDGLVLSINPEWRDLSEEWQ